MTKSVFTPKYQKFMKILIEERKKSGLTQSGVAKLLNKPQSYVSKYENGERRLDIVEFLELVPFLDFDVYKVINELN